MDRCVDKFCDPIRTADVSLPDMMICAPWAGDSFSCLTNGMDHTPCCRSRGLPAPCVQLCAGNVTRVDFNHFRCIQYMDEMSNCLLQGYGVLASAPTRFKVTHINPTFAILRWEQPRTLGKTVVSYNVRYRPTGGVGGGGDEEADDSADYKLVNTKGSPYILEHLSARSEYEVYVSAVNDHGVGEPSTRLIFRTAADSAEEETSSNTSYNVTSCCHAVHVSSHCMPLCDYSAKLSDVQALITSCSSELPKLLRCGAGGRNHIGCCERRGIPDPCLGFCSASLTEDLLTTAAACLPFVGNVIQCFEEGTDVIPAPVVQLHATDVTETSVTLEWTPPDQTESVTTHYVVHYTTVDQNSSKAGSASAADTYQLDSQLTVTEPMALIGGLTTGVLYNMFVLAANEHGTSLPSSILTINVTKKGD